MPRTRSRRLAAALLSLAVVTGDLAMPRAAAATTLRVLAAASLTGVFGEIAREFERTRDGVKVETSFAGSSTLVQQIREGAPADVFASADEASMRTIVELGLEAGDPRIFARNRLAIAVEPGNPKRIERLADLAKPGLIVALAGAAVPAGRYAREAFAKAGVAVPQASQEVDVKGVVRRVALGEADAGIVYATDGAGAKIELVAIPDAHNVIASYPIAVLKDAQNPVAAEAFIDFVLGSGGRDALTRGGFLVP